MWHSPQVRSLLIIGWAAGSRLLTPFAATSSAARVAPACISAARATQRLILVRAIASDIPPRIFSITERGAIRNLVNELKADLNVGLSLVLHF